MTEQLYAIPALSATTSTEVRLSSSTTTNWALTRPVARLSSEVVSAAVRALDGGSRDRLAALREAAAHRARTMPMFDDPEDERAQRDAESEAIDRLQAQASAWTTED